MKRFLHLDAFSYAIMSSESEMYTATISHPAPRNALDGPQRGLDGLYHFVRRTLAPLGIVITNFHPPTYPETRDGSVSLVNIKFDFVVEKSTHDRHRTDFRLANDSLSFRQRLSYAEQMIVRMNDFAVAEAEYYGKDKETRGPFKQAVSVRALEVVHTPGISTGEEGEVTRREGFWKMKLVRPRVVRQVSAPAPAFR